MDAVAWAQKTSMSAKVLGLGLNLDDQSAKRCLSSSAMAS